MNYLPPARNTAETRWIGPWPAKAAGYDNICIVQATREVGGVILLIEGLKNKPSDLARKCPDVSVQDAADGGVCIKGDLFQFIDTALKDGFLSGPLLSARAALESLVSPSPEAARGNAHQRVRRITAQHLPKDAP